MSNQSILENYKDELMWARVLKVTHGATGVSAAEAGEKLAAGREVVPIDEYIKHWQDGITAMEAGADPALYNY